jgi:hypothetical protein
VSRPRDSRHNSRAGHPAWRRCSSLTNSRFARSSRLASRAPRSGIYATYHSVGTLATPVNDNSVTDTAFPLERHARKAWTR